MCERRKECVVVVCMKKECVMNKRNGKKNFSVCACVSPMLIPSSLRTCF